VLSFDYILSMDTEAYNDVHPELVSLKDWSYINHPSRKNLGIPQ